MKQKINSICAKVTVKALAFTNDVTGSDTTEKIGMVVVAVVIVGLLATAINGAMPGIFSGILGTAESKLNGIFG